MLLFQVLPVILTGVPGDEPANHSSGPNCLFSPEQEESPGGIQFCCLLKILWLLEGSPKIFSVGMDRVLILTFPVMITDNIEYLQWARHCS